MAGEDGTAAAGADHQARSRLRWRALGVGALGVVAFVALAFVAPPRQVIDQIGDMRPAWVGASVGLELGSCLSYVVIFRRFFPEPPRAVSRRVAWIAMGAGAILPGGNISSAAATGLLMRRNGVAGRKLLERCAALLFLLTAIGFAVNGAAAVLLLARVPDGPHDLSHTVFPILVSVVVLSLAALLTVGGRRLGGGAPRLLRGLAAGLEGAWREMGALHWRLLGGVGFLCLDMAALWAACAATGHRIGFLAVVVAYCIGYLATIIPVPAGLGVLDSGLAASLVLYGMSPAASVGAVLVYHAISIWVPGLGGLIAWLPTRRRRPGATGLGTLASGA
ncbi:MAG: lysylphosphatidylglycerol synthase transmembrane domain-containing protein [Solirubrobacteraceae bacterium]